MVYQRHVRCVGCLKTSAAAAAARAGSDAGREEMMETKARLGAGQSECERCHEVIQVS